MFSKFQDHVFTSPDLLADYLFRIRENYYCSESKHVFRSDEIVFTEKLLIYCLKFERGVNICCVYISVMMSHFREGINSKY